MTAVAAQRAAKFVVVNLAGGECGDDLAIHPVVVCRLEDRVVRLARRVHDAVWVALTREEHAVQVALRASGRDVAPVVPLFYLPQLVYLDYHPLIYEVDLFALLSFLH